MSATHDGAPAAPVDGAPSPFTIIGDDAALCEGDECALPAPAAGRTAASDAVPLATTPRT